MSSDRPIPPSIPPRKGPGRSGPRPSTAPPRVVTPSQHEPSQHEPPQHEPSTSTPASVPVVKAAPVVKLQPASAQPKREAGLPTVAPTPGPVAPPALAHLAAPTAPVAPRPVDGEAAAVPVASVVTETLSKAFRRASTAVAGATAAVGAEFTRITKPRTDTDGSPSLSPKADPTIAATETHAAAGSPRTSAASSPTPSVRTTASSGMPTPSAARDGAPRRVRLAVSRIDPWSVMKLAFLLSVAIGIMIVVAAAVVWFILDGLAVFTKANDMITEIAGAESSLNILKYVEFSRVVSGATVIAVVDVVLLTALSTIGAFLYNITAALVGGVNLTLTDD